MRRAQQRVLGDYNEPARVMLLLQESILQSKAAKTTMARVEKEAKMVVANAAMMVQKRVRGIFARKRYQRMKEADGERKRAAAIFRCATKIQRNWRGRTDRKRARMKALGVWRKFRDPVTGYYYY